MEPLLQVRDLTVSYAARQGGRIDALRDVGFGLATDEVLGVLGESGSGKTTLALTLLGMLPKAASVRRGEIKFQGKNFRAANPEDSRTFFNPGIALVSQEPGLALNPVMRIRTQVAEVLRAHQPLTAKQAKQSSRELLAQVEFDPQSHIDEAFPHQLSGGQRQRVVIAQALACRPAILIADEPTTALDAALQAEILALLQSLQKQHHFALILITHHPAALIPIAHRILVMYAGRIVEEGPARQVLESPLHPYTQGLLRCGANVSPGEFRAQPLSTIPGEPPNPSALPAGCAFAPRCPARQEACDRRAPGESRPEASRHVWCFKYD